MKGFYTRKYGNFIFNCSLIHFFFCERVENDDGDGYCPGIIQSATQILTYQCKFNPSKPVSIFVNRKNTLQKLAFNMPQSPMITIKNPRWEYVKNYKFLVLEKAIKYSKKHAAICIAKSNENLPADRVYVSWEKSYYASSKDAFWQIVDKQNKNLTGWLLSIV